MSSGIALAEFAMVGPGERPDSSRLNGVVPIDLCTSAFKTYVSGAHTGPTRSDAL